jgi:ATP-binding cassette, subfamily B, bacterial
MKRQKLLFEIIKDKKTNFLIAITLLMISIMTRTIEPKIIQIIIDKISKPTKVSTDFFIIHFTKWIDLFTTWTVLEKIGLLCVVYVILAGIRSGFILWSRAISFSAAEKSIQKFRVNIFEHIQKIPMSAFNILNKGELIQRSTGDIDTIKNFISNHSIELIRLFALFTFSSIMLFQINFIYALCCISLCPLIFYSTYRFFQYEGKVWQQHEDEADKLTNIAQENLNGIRTVKAYHQMESEIKKFNLQNEKKLQIGLKQIKLHTYFWPLNDFLMYMQTLIFIILGGVFVLDGRLSLGELVAAYTYNSMLSFPIKQAGRVLSQMSMALVAIDRIQDIISLPREKMTGAKVENLKGEIEFKNVNFAYKDGEKNVLNHLNFKINQGEKIAIMGKSATGKSTMMKLLMRLYEPTSGEIFINQIPINNYQLNQYRNRIGYVMQQPILFSMELGNNLSYANDTITTEEKISALHHASFSNYDTILTKGMETEIGERGVSLSGGQKQRLALARTLVKENDILILDDTTSALDKETERNVLKNLFELYREKTMCIITHRISILNHVDKIIILNENGEIDAIGNLNELINTNEYLKELQKIETNNIEQLTTNN